MEFSLIVNSHGQATVDILTYIDDQILDLRKAGVTLKIQVIKNKDLKKKAISDLKAAGIKSLPALIFEGTNIKKIGVTQIKAFIRSNMDRFHKTEDARKTERTKMERFGTYEEPTLSNYYATLMDKNVDMNDDSEMGEKSSTNDFDRKRNEMQSKRTSRLRQYPERRAQQPQSNNVIADKNPQSDNIAMPPRKKGPATTAIDDMVTERYMNNTSVDY